MPFLAVSQINKIRCDIVDGKDGEVYLNANAEADSASRQLIICTASDGCQTYASAVEDENNPEYYLNAGHSSSNKLESALMPIISLIVSFNISYADLSIIIDIKTPKYPSKLICHIMLISAPITVVKDKTESLIASVPLAIKLFELSLMPSFFTYLPKKNLTNTATIIINKETTE